GSQPVMSSDDGGPPDAVPHTLVHWFQSDGVWWVCSGDTSLRCTDRTAAFEAAEDLARRTSPSRLTSAAHPRWRGGPSEEASPLDRSEARINDSVDWTRVAGPRPLGRSLLVSRGAEIAARWNGCARIAVPEQRLEDPSFLAEVREAFLARSPVIYDVEPTLEPPTWMVHDTEVWNTPVDHDFVAETAWALLTRNAVDARSGTPVWGLADRAIALGATRGQHTDV